MNKYLEKIAGFERSLANLENRGNQLIRASGNRSNKIQKGLSNKSELSSASSFFKGIDLKDKVFESRLKSAVSDHKKIVDRMSNTINSFKTQLKD